MAEDSETCIFWCTRAAVNAGVAARLLQAAGETAINGTVKRSHTSRSRWYRDGMCLASLLLGKLHSKTPINTS